MTSKRKMFFSNDELSVLQEAFRLACLDLRLGTNRQFTRAHVGVLMFEIASAGEGDCEVLRRQCVRRFRRGAAARPLEIGSTEMLSLVVRRKQHLHRTRSSRFSSADGAP